MKHDFDLTLLFVLNFASYIRFHFLRAGLIQLKLIERRKEHLFWKESQDLFILKSLGDMKGKIGFLTFFLKSVISNWEALQVLMKKK